MVDSIDNTFCKARKKKKSKRFTKILIKTMALLKLLQNYGNPENVFPKKQLEIICVKWELKPNR